MSVINKMLRDLDQRDAQGPALRSGTSSLSRSVRRSRSPISRSTWLAGWVILAVLVAALGAVLLAPSGALKITTSSPRAEVPVPPPTPSAVAATAIPAPAPVAAAIASGTRASAVAPTAAAPAALKDPKAAPSAPEAGAVREAAAVRTVPAIPAPGGASAVERQQQAVKDVIAQAQGLWNTGARQAAIDLVQESLALAERSAGSGAALEPGPVALVRELARMQLADGHPGAAWELLSGLESRLRNEPDLWAVRANAAQRLGRHQDSVHSYMMALQSRPGEQRWLLGSAVSLAALGQTAKALEMAEKARAVGPVGKDVLTYLRQMGVPLGDL